MLPQAQEQGAIAAPGAVETARTVSSEPRKDTPVKPRGPTPASELSECISIVEATWIVVFVTEPWEPMHAL